MVAQTSCLRATLSLLAVLLLAVAGCADARATPSHNVSKRRPWDILGQQVSHNKLAVQAPRALSVVALHYYVQVALGGPDVQVLIPAINTTTLNNFGQTQVFMFNVTAEEDSMSTQLGHIRGLTMQASYTSKSVGVEVEVLEYNDGTLNGTISIQGLVFNGPSLVSVVGGTGDFAGAKGYGNVTLVASSESRAVYHHDLHFL